MYNFGVVMTEEEKKLLNSFETQLRHLIYLHDELKRENAELKKLLENEKLKNEKVQAQYDELEVSYTNLKTATAISLNGSDVKETKLRLSKLVREVDKCAFLMRVFARSRESRMSFPCRISGKPRSMRATAC